MTAMAEYDPYQQRFVKVEADITEMKGDIPTLKVDVAV
jgi:hypothetical protein